MGRRLALAPYCWPSVLVSHDLLITVGVGIVEQDQKGLGEGLAQVGFNKGGPREAVGDGSLNSGRVYHPALAATAISSCVVFVAVVSYGELTFRIRLLSKSAMK